MFALFKKDRQLSDLHKDLSLDEKTMPHVYDIVTLRQLHNDLLLDEKTMPHVYDIVSRIYGSYTTTYFLMGKQCLMFMLMLAASWVCTLEP